MTKTRVWRYECAIGRIQEGRELAQRVIDFIGKRRTSVMLCFQCFVLGGMLKCCSLSDE